jgi:tetratricopeptide (TPR) repeat protein
VPGALASWFVSTSARTFTAPPPGWSPGSGYAGSAQSLVADLIAEGVTGTVGFVYEPYLDATARPQILFPAYRAGFTLAESFYMALPFLSWQAVVVGDPLLAPFGPPPVPRSVPLPGAILFLRRRAVALEDLVARAPSPDAQRALALAYAEQARELQRAERLDEALTLAQRAVAVKADEPLALYVLGAVHAARREPDQAAEAFKTLLRHDSNSPYAQEAERWLAR